MGHVGTSKAVAMSQRVTLIFTGFMPLLGHRTSFFIFTICEKIFYAFRQNCNLVLKITQFKIFTKRTDLSERKYMYQILIEIGSDGPDKREKPTYRNRLRTQLASVNSIK